MGERRAGDRMVYDAEQLTKLARSGADMPAGLSLSEVWLFQSMRHLYAEFGRGRLTQEAGKRERVQIMNAYRTAASMEKMWRTVCSRYQTGEAAVSVYRREPTIEHADCAIDALYGGVGRKLREVTG